MRYKSNYLTNVNVTGNVVWVLRSREYAYQCVQPKNLAILKTLICRGDTMFRKVWEKKSSRHISYERKYLYFENYTECYEGSAKTSVPRLLYKLPQIPKIEDALIVFSDRSTPPLTDVHCNSLLTISKDQYLTQRHLETGRETTRIFVNSLSRFKLRDISWNNVCYSIVLKATSTQLQRQETAESARPRVSIVFALFDINPLQFVGQMEIDRQVFGYDQTGAMVTSDMLIVMFQSGYIKVFSIPYIISKYRMYQVKLNEVVPGSDSVCGSYPAGTPINIKITDCPPVLLSVRATNQDLQIGGFPWHYLITPYGRFNEFTVYAVATHQLADNGSLLGVDDIYLPDHASFHNDDSGRIIYVGSEAIRMFKISSEDGVHCSVQTLFTININTRLPEKKVLVTSSGRTVDRRKVYDDEVSNYTSTEITGVEYEDELDVLTVVSVTDSSQSGYISTLGLYDNLTGEKLRDVQLETPYPEYVEHRVTLDLDTIVETIKGSPSSFTCIVYKLVAVVQDEEEAKQRQKTGRSKRRSRRTR